MTKFGRAVVEAEVLGGIAGALRPGGGDAIEGAAWGMDFRLSCLASHISPGNAESPAGEMNKPSC